MIGKAVSCVAKVLNQAGHIVERLRLAGFSRNDISVLCRAARPKGDDGSVQNALEWLGFATGGPTNSAVVVGGPILVGMLNAEGASGFQSVLETLCNFGIPEPEAKRYEEAIQAGGIWFSVVVSNQDGAERARWIFEDTGAEQIATT